LFSFLSASYEKYTVFLNLTLTIFYSPIILLLLFNLPPNSRGTPSAPSYHTSVPRHTLKMGDICAVYWQNSLELDKADFCSERLHERDWKYEPSLWASSAWEFASAVNHLFAVPGWINICDPWILLNQGCFISFYAKARFSRQVEWGNWCSVHVAMLVTLHMRQFTSYSPKHYINTYGNLSFIFLYALQVSRSCWEEWFVYEFCRILSCSVLAWWLIQFIVLLFLNLHSII
jgi:hypothetical protein